MNIAEFTSKVIGDKRRWRAYQTRVHHLPANYRTAVEAVERYVMYFGPADGDSVTSMFEDLADLFEQAVADGTSIRELVGDNPVEFVETFLDNYAKGGWVTQERERLTSAIERAEGTRA